MWWALVRSTCSYQLSNDIYFYTTWEKNKKNHKISNKKKIVIGKVYNWRQQLIYYGKHYKN